MGSKLTITVLSISLAIVLGLTGRLAYISSHSASPETITKTVSATFPVQYIENEVIREVEIVREVPVTITVPAVKIVEVSKQYKDWQSVEQFKDWYNSKNFTYLMPNGGDPETADCDDYASWVAREALSDGYLVSLALVDDTGCIYGTPVAEPYHMGCLITVGNDIYYVEPQSSEFNVIWITTIDSVESYQKR